MEYTFAIRQPSKANSSGLGCLVIVLMLVFTFFLFIAVPFLMIVVVGTIGLVVKSIGWFWWVIFATALAFAIFYYKNRDKDEDDWNIIRVNEDGFTCHFPKLLLKEPWSNINHVILEAEVLKIVFKDGRTFRSSVLPSSFPMADFKDFCERKTTIA